MPIIELPNGKTVEFPDDMPMVEIEKVLAAQFPAQGVDIRTAAANKPKGMDIHTALKSRMPLNTPQLGQGDTPGAIPQWWIDQGPESRERIKLAAGLVPVAGAMAANRLVPGSTGPLLGMLARTGLTAAGGMAGEGLVMGGEKLVGDPNAPRTGEEAMGRAALSGGIMAAPELLGPTAGLAFRPKISPETARLAQIAQREKLPINVNLIAPSKLGTVLDKTSAALPPGRVVKSMQAKKLEDGMIRMIEDQKGLIPVAETMDTTTAGKNLAESMKGGKKVLREKTMQAYEDFSTHLRTTKGDKLYKLDNTAKIIEENLDKFKEGSEGADFFGRALDRMTKPGVGGLTGKEVNELQKGIWSKTYPGNSKVGGDVWSALRKDLGKESPELIAALDAAKEAHKAYLDFSGNYTVKSVMKKYGMKQPDQILKAAFTAGNIDDVILIKKAVSPEAFNDASGKFIQNILDSAVKEESGQLVFNPNTFIKNYNKYSTQIRNVMPDVAKNMDDLTKLVRMGAPDLAKKSMTPGEMMIQGTLAGAGAFGSVVNPAVAVPYGFSYAVSRSMTKPSGAIKQWLLTGKVPKTLKVGTKAVQFGTISQTEQRGEE